jgi:ketosteroid isomerase-like protein
MSASKEQEEVRHANQDFYRAFESLELPRMEAAWAHEGQVTCAHPGWPLADGWAAVRRSWETIFRNTSEITFDVTGEQIEVRGELAWVVCVERVSSGTDRGAVLATNVLRRGADGRWRLVHHHGSAYVTPRVERERPPAPPAAKKSPHGMN